MINTEHHDLLSMLSRDTDLKRVAATDGGEFAGPCPFCGGKDRFRVWPNHSSGSARWWCRQCGKSGDAIAYRVERGTLTPSEAGQLRRSLQLRDSRKDASDQATASPPTRSTNSGPPSPRWQARALEWVKSAQDRLWNAGGFSLSEIRQWGLSDVTIRSWHLGWSEGGQLPRGIVIPHFAYDGLWAVKIRRYEGDVPSHRPKYTQMKNGRAALYGVDHLRGRNKALLLVEGEKDCMLAWQELGDLIDVTSLAGATRGVAPRWAKFLVAYEHVVLAYDADEAGREGARRMSSFIATAESITVPTGTDIVGFHQRGHNLRAWLKYHLKRLGIVSPHTPTPPEPQQPRPEYVAWAEETGRQYWTLRPLCELNNNLDKLDQKLARGRQAAQRLGVAEVLEQSWRAAKPET